MDALALAMADQPGNPEAVDLADFERIILEHERRVYLAALHLLGNRADAQDAAQEVWLRAYRSLKRIDPDRDLAAWLYRVTVNVCRDIGRRRRRTEPLEDVAAGASTEADVGREEERRMVTRALRSLPERERAAMVLRDVEGLSTREVAGILGCSEATVRSHSSSARLKVKKFLEGWLRRRS